MRGCAPKWFASSELLLIPACLLGVVYTNFNIGSTHYTVYSEGLTAVGCNLSVITDARSHAEDCAVIV